MPNLNSHNVVTVHPSAVPHGRSEARGDFPGLVSDLVWLPVSHGGCGGTYAAFAAGRPDALSLLATLRIRARVAFSRISCAASGRRARLARRAAATIVWPCS